MATVQLRWGSPFMLIDMYRPGILNPNEYFDICIDLIAPAVLF